MLRSKWSSGDLIFYDEATGTTVLKVLDSTGGVIVAGNTFTTSGLTTPTIACAGAVSLSTTGSLITGTGVSITTIAAGQTFITFGSCTAYASGVSVNGQVIVGVTATGVLKVAAGGTAYYIPLYAASQLTGE